MTTELAEIRPYTAPYWKERAWNLDHLQDWERELLAAVKVRGVLSIEDELDVIAGEPYGKTRAFAIDYNPDIIEAGCEYINEDSERMHPKPHAPQLRRWRQLRAAQFTPFDPALTEQMITDLAIVEEGALEELRRAHLEADDQLKAQYADRGIT